MVLYSPVIYSNSQPPRLTEAIEPPRQPAPGICLDEGQEKTA